MRNRRNVLLLPGQTFRCLLRDDFTTDAAAPLGDTHTCEPGPGTLTKWDSPTPSLAISGGKLTSGPVSGMGRGQPGFLTATMARQIGLTAAARMTKTGGGGQFMGWQLVEGMVWGIHFSLGIIDGPQQVNLSIPTLAADVTYDVAVVQRKPGMLYFIRGGVYADWTLLFVHDEFTDDLGASVGGSSSTPPDCDTFRVVELGKYDSRLGAQYGLALDRLVAPAQGTSFSHEADGLIQWRFTFGAQAMELRYRIVDANNYLWIAPLANGYLERGRCVAGVRAPQSSLNAAFANGATYRILLRTIGNQNAVFTKHPGDPAYYARLVFTENNFLTATAGSLAASPSATEEIVVWPLKHDLPRKLLA